MNATNTYLARLERDYLWIVCVFRSRIGHIPDAGLLDPQHDVQVFVCGVHVCAVSDGEVVLGGHVQLYTGDEG